MLSVSSLNRIRLVWIIHIRAYAVVKNTLDGIRYTSFDAPDDVEYCARTAIEARAAIHIDLKPGKPQ